MLMPVWLQLITALTAAAASGVMGMALVPFLQKLHFCEPDTPSGKELEAQGNRLRPTMCGLLLLFGCMTSLVLSFALYRTFCTLDSTSLSVQTETRGMLACVGYAVLSAAAGFTTDLHIIRRKPLRSSPKLLRSSPKLLRFLGVFLLTALFQMHNGMNTTVLDFGFQQYDAGVLYVPLTAAMGAALWLCIVPIERDTDGISISMGGIFLLGITILFLQNARFICALPALAASGACMGSLIWNLHPAKCRLGKTGSFWMAGMITALSLQHGQHQILLLTMLVYLLDLLPAWCRGGKTLQAWMHDAGMKHWQQIAVFSGFAAFCSILATLP